jgi:hypothetical protein
MLSLWLCRIIDNRFGVLRLFSTHTQIRTPVLTCRHIYSAHYRHSPAYLVCAWSRRGFFHGTLRCRLALDVGLFGGAAGRRDLVGLKEKRFLKRERSWTPGFLQEYRTYSLK